MVDCVVIAVVGIWACPICLGNSEVPADDLVRKVLAVQREQLGSTHPLIVLLRERRDRVEILKKAFGAAPTVERKVCVVDVLYSTGLRSETSGEFFRPSLILSDSVVVAEIVALLNDNEAAVRQAVVAALIACPDDLLRPHGDAVVAALREHGKLGEQDILLVGKTGCAEAREFLREESAKLPGEVQNTRIVVAIETARARLGDAEFERKLVRGFLVETALARKIAGAERLGYVGTPGAVAALASELRSTAEVEGSGSRVPLRHQIIRALGMAMPYNTLFWEPAPGLCRLEWYAQIDNWAEEIMGQQWDKLPEWKVDVFSALGGMPAFAGYARTMAKYHIAEDVEPEVRKQIERLYEEEDSERYDATCRLGEMGTRAVAAIPFLVAMLSDTALAPSGSVGSSAAEALAKIGQPSKEPLIAVLGGLDTPVDARVNAAYALGNIGGALATENLVGVLNNKQAEPRLRDAGAWALGRLEDPKVADALITVVEDKGDRPDVRSQVANALGQQRDPRVARVLIGVLRNETNDEVRLGAVSGLGRCDAPGALECLMELLKNKRESSPVRARAAEGLGKSDQPKALDVLLGIVQDNTNDPSVRGAAVFGLSGMKFPRRLELLTSILRDRKENLNVRLDAARGLGKSGGLAAVGVLVGALRSEDEEEVVAHGMRLVVVDSLVKIGAPAVPQLVDALRDKDREVRWAATLALGQIKHESAVQGLANVITDKAEDRKVRLCAARAIAGIGAPARSLLLQMLHDRDPSVRALSARALGEMSERSALDAVLGLMDDQEPSVRQSAADSLGLIGDPRATVALVSAATDKEIEVRTSAVGALSRIRDPRVTEALVSALADSAAVIRLQAATGLGRVKSAEAVPALARCLSDKDTAVRMAAAKALAGTGLPAAEPLVGVLKSDDFTARFWATQVLAGIGDPVVELLVRALRDENKYVRRGAAEALAEIGNAGSSDALMAALADTDRGVRWRAALGLSELSRQRRARISVTGNR